MSCAGPADTLPMRIGAEAGTDEVATGRGDPGVPPRGTSPSRQGDVLGVEAGPRDEPRDHRVRVPHVPRPKLVAPPDGCGHRRYELEHTVGQVAVGREATRALHCLRRVGDVAVPPTAHLVAEEAQATRGPQADRTFSDDSSCSAARAGHRGLLDDEAAFRHDDLESGVVEIAWGSPFREGPQRLVEPAVP